MLHTIAFSKFATVGLALALGVALLGCVSSSDINDGFRRIDRAWQLEYQRTEDEFRYRVVDADYLATYQAVRMTFLDLGLPVQARDVETGVLVAENAAPAPLTAEEWKRVVATENPRLESIGGAMFKLDENSSSYIVTIQARVRPIAGKTFILLDYKISAPKYERIGLQPSRHAPPSAVQIASLKFWEHLRARLVQSQIAARPGKAPAPPPAPRRRTKDEMEV